MSFSSVFLQMGDARLRASNANVRFGVLLSLNVAPGGEMIGKEGRSDCCRSFYARPSATGGAGCAREGTCGGNGAQVNLAFGQFHEEILAGEGLAVFWTFYGAKIAAIGLLLAGLYGVGEQCGEDLVVNAGFRGRVAHGEGHFAPLEEVARH